MREMDGCRWSGCRCRSTAFARPLPRPLPLLARTIPTSPVKHDPGPQRGVHRPAWPRPRRLRGDNIGRCGSRRGRGEQDRSPQDISGHFIALIGPKRQDDPPYLGTPYTNFSCLRSFIDRRTGETAQQLYVAASYDRNHDWTAAYDSRGRSLKFLPISRFPIACQGKADCSYAEEFAAKLPQNELEENPQGFSVTFVAKNGDKQTVAVSSSQVAAQLTALTAYRRAAKQVSAAGVAAR